MYTAIRADASSMRRQWRSSNRSRPQIEGAARVKTCQSGRRPGARHSPTLADSDAPAVETPAPTTEADGAATPTKSKPAKRKGKPKATKAAPAAGELEAASGQSAAKPTPRAGTKQAKVIEMLKRPEGATVEQIAAVTGWQHHTIRGAISGAVDRTREVGPNKSGAKGSATTYRITG